MSKRGRRKEEIEPEEKKRREKEGKQRERSMHGSWGYGLGGNSEGGE